MIAVPLKPPITRVEVERRLTQHGKSLRWLAKYLDVNRQALINWLEGDNAPRDPEIWVRIRTALESLAFLPSTEPSNVMVVHDERVRYGFAVSAAIPSFRGVMAGNFDDEATFEADAFVEVPTAFLIGGAAKIDQHAAVLISGRSLEPRVKSGDMVLIYCDTALYKNSIVLAKSPDGRVYLKVLREGKGTRYELHSLSKHGSNFEDLDGWQILGYSICIISDDDEPGHNVEWRRGRPLKA